MNDKRDSDKRESAGTAAESLLPIIADLETIDRKLAGHAAASEALELGTIEKARTHVRGAIGTLASLMAEEAGSAKQRGKGKAPAKSAARGGRKQPAAEGPPETPPLPSLLARLGAVVQATSEQLAESKPEPEAALPPHSAKSTSPDRPQDKPQDEPRDKPKNTAERLAQLEAEIADLTQAVTASPTRSGAAPARPASALVMPTAKPEALDLASDDDEDSEIVIVGATGAPAGGRIRAGRNVPRILADAPPPAEEDAEVEIRGQDAARARRLTHAPDAARANGEAGKGASGRWRLFRGSR